MKPLKFIDISQGGVPKRDHLFLYSIGLKTRLLSPSKYTLEIRQQ